MSAFVVTPGDMAAIVGSSVVLGALLPCMFCEWLAQRKEPPDPEQELDQLHHRARSDMNEAAGQGWRDISEWRDE